MSGKDGDSPKVSGATRAARASVDPKLLEMLACPLTKSPLSWHADAQELVSRGARLAYPVRDGVPILLPSEARTLREDELDR